MEAGIHVYCKSWSIHRLAYLWIKPKLEFPKLNMNQNQYLWIEPFSNRSRPIYNLSNQTKAFQPYSADLQSFKLKSADLRSFEPDLYTQSERWVQVQFGLLNQVRAPLMYLNLQGAHKHLKREEALGTIKLVECIYLI